MSFLVAAKAKVVTTLLFKFSSFSGEAPIQTPVSG